MMQLYTFANNSKKMHISPICIFLCIDCNIIKARLKTIWKGADMIKKSGVKVDKERIKTFDEVMKAIKKENYNELKKTCERLDGIEKQRVDAIIEMIKFDEGFKITNKSKKLTKIEENDTLTYKCEKPTYIEDAEKHFGTIKIEAADVVKVENGLDANILELKNCDSESLHGRIIFDKQQKADSLIIKDTAVRGKFNVEKVVIDGMTYLDLYLDADDTYQNTKLKIRPNDEDVRDSLFTDEIGKNIRGNINLSINFYNKLSKENKLNILKSSRFSANILIEGIPIFIYNFIKFHKIDIEVARKQLIRYKEEYGKALSDDVEFECR